MSAVFGIREGEKKPLLDQGRTSQEVVGKSSEISAGKENWLAKQKMAEVKVSDEFMGAVGLVPSGSVEVSQRPLCKTAINTSEMGEWVMRPDRTSQYQTSHCQLQEYTGDEAKECLRR
jgi:hypothetical protein